MKYLVTDKFTVKSSQGERSIHSGQVIEITETKAAGLIASGKIRLFDIPVTSMLEKLSDSERDIYDERAAIMEYDGGLPREQAEVEAIKRIIRERVISGKCDKCERVNGCMMTRGQRVLCEVVRP